jgi:hypothetical protein
MPTNQNPHRALPETSPRDVIGGAGSAVRSLPVRLHTAVHRAKLTRALAEGADPRLTHELSLRATADQRAQPRWEPAVQPERSGDPSADDPRGHRRAGCATVSLARVRARRLTYLPIMTRRAGEGRPHARSRPDAGRERVGTICRG